MTTYNTVLFDLDGTLIDTAPDMGLALNLLLQEHNEPTLPQETIRPHVSNGANALISLGFGRHFDDDERIALQQRYLTLYRENIAVHSALFDGMGEVLTTLEQRNIKWGVVTNKPDFLTNPLMDALQLSQRAACIVSGNTCSHSKPHPAPMEYALGLCHTTGKESIYVGDAERDIQAGRAVNMFTVIAGFGYIEPETDKAQWQADAEINTPIELLNWL